MEDSMYSAGLSIVIPFRNRKHCVDKCFNLLLRQFIDFDLEILIADLNSTDNSLNYIMKNYKDSRLSIYRHTRSKAFNDGKARNIGVLLAKYDLIFTFDIDNIILRRDYLQRIYDLWCISEKKMREKGGKPLRGHVIFSEFPIDFSMRPKKNGVIIRTTGSGNCVYHKDLFYAVGGYDYISFCGKGYSDMAFLLMAVRQGFFPIMDMLARNRLKNEWMINKKDKELPNNKKVGIGDVWESDISMRPVYDKLLGKKYINKVEIDFGELLTDVERII